MNSCWVVKKEVMLGNLKTEISKQSQMADHTNTVPLFFGSPSFKGFIFKPSTEAEPVISPTSILEPFSPFKNPFGSDKNQPKSPKENKHSWDKLDSKGIGIALIDDDERLDEHNNCNKTVLFGTKLRVQIPPPANSMIPAANSPVSPCDFGLKTRNSQLSASGSPSSCIQTKDSPRAFTGCLSMSEMELSEDYTCVITYGPNTKTTHIFDNCVLDNYCSSNSAPKNFLSFCYTCKKNLDKEVDIFIYRGEKAFCSQDCRYQEMVLDGIEN